MNNVVVLVVVQKINQEICNLFNPVTKIIKDRISKNCVSTLTIKGSIPFKNKALSRNMDIFSEGNLELSLLLLEKKKKKKC